LVEDEERNTFKVLLRINNWTILQDIRGIWKKVEKYQNALWKKQERKTNFARDLCWYDLSKRQGLKLKEIAELWDSEFPEEIDLLVIRKIKKEIAEKDLRGRALDDFQLLETIRSGFLAEKYKSFFLESREFYTTGKMKREDKLYEEITEKSVGKRTEELTDFLKDIERVQGKIPYLYHRSKDPTRRFNPPFIDAIKKAIKRMEEQIADDNISQRGFQDEAEKILFKVLSKIQPD
jgi:hypothetical protein